MQEELIFEIELNNEGRGYILRLFIWIRLVFIAAIIWSAINLLSAISGIITASRVLGFQDYLLNARLMGVFIFTFLNVILVPLQAYYYYSFSKQIRESLDEQDTVKFNGSFKLLNSNAVIAFISIMLSISFSLFNIFHSFFR